MHVIHVWRWLPLVTNTCLQLTKHKWARTGPSLTHTFQMNRAHMFHTPNSEWITWNYESSVIFMILILELGLMQPRQLRGFCHGGCHEHHKSLPSAFTHITWIHTHTHKPALSSRLLAHIATDCAPVDLWCVNNRVFFFYEGLGQTVFGANWSLCCTLSHLLEHISLFPVTQARTWQNWTVDHIHTLSTEQRSLCAKTCRNIWFIKKKDHCHYFF